MNINIEDFIPHRGRMKLVEEVLAVDAKGATTSATTREEWPLVEQGYVNPIVCIELVAETMGISIGWDEHTRLNKKMAGSGWIVGVRKASFLIDRIPLGERIITRSWEKLSHKEYAEVEGTSSIGGAVIATVLLQALRTDMDSDFSKIAKML